MGNSITMKDLEAINFPYYYNLVKEGRMKAGEVYDLLFNGNPRVYYRYKNVMEGKQATPQKRKEYMKEYRKGWKEANPDYIKEHMKERRKTDKYKEYQKEYKKEYYKKRRQTPEGKAYFIRKNQKRRALKKGNGGVYTQDEWNKCLDYFNHCDAYTGEPLKSTEIEHVIPISKGGTNNIYNIVPANKSTNCSKYNSDVFEWYSQQEYFDWNRYIKICLWIIKSGGAIE